MHLPAMSIGHSESREALELHLKQTFDLSLILTEKGAKDYYVLGFHSDRIFLYKNQLQIGELHGYSFDLLLEEITSLKTSAQSKRSLKTGFHLFVVGTSAYLLNSIFVGSFSETSSLVVAVTLALIYQIHRGYQRVEYLMALEELKFKLAERKNSSSKIFFENLPMLEKVMGKLQAHHRRQKKKACKNSAK